MGQKQRVYPILFLCILLILELSGCKDTASPVTRTGFYFDTVVQITLYDDRKENLIDDCFKMAENFEKLVSKTVEGSEIYDLNHAKGAPVIMSEETLDLLEAGLYYCQLSEGAFDITIGALAQLWDIKNNPGMTPSESDISAALSGVGYENISIKGNEVTLANPGTQLDLGAIAKGYIADRMKDYLNECGVREGIINVGGNVLVLGPKADGSPYVIGIQRPFSTEGTAMYSVEITDGTVVSSGVYERYFEKDGTIYHHILNPVSGYPYQNGLLSVTIFCPESVDGDGLSTTCFSLGLEKGMALIESIPDAEAVFITEDYELAASSGIGTKIPYHVLE